MISRCKIVSSASGTTRVEITLQIWTYSFNQHCHHSLKELSSYSKSQESYHPFPLAKSNRQLSVKARLSHLLWDFDGCRILWPELKSVRLLSLWTTNEEGFNGSGMSIFSILSKFIYSLISWVLYSKPITPKQEDVEEEPIFQQQHEPKKGFTVIKKNEEINLRQNLWTSLCQPDEKKKNDMVCTMLGISRTFVFIKQEDWCHINTKKGQKIQHILWPSDQISLLMKHILKPSSYIQEKHCEDRNSPDPQPCLPVITTMRRARHQ